MADRREIAASGGVRDSVSAPSAYSASLAPRAYAPLPGTRGAKGGLGALSSSSAGLTRSYCPILGRSHASQIRDIDVSSPSRFHAGSGPTWYWRFWLTLCFGEDLLEAQTEARWRVGLSVATLLARPTLRHLPSPRIRARKDGAWRPVWELRTSKTAGARPPAQGYLHPWVWKPNPMGFETGVTNILHKAHLSRTSRVFDCPRQDTY